MQFGNKKTMLNYCFVIVYAKIIIIFVKTIILITFFAMDKKERFREAFKYLRSNGIVHTQKDVADKMGSTSPNVSRALNGAEGVMTDRFLIRFAEAFDINMDWLLTGSGEMLAANVVSGNTIRQTGDSNVATIGRSETAGDSKALERENELLRDQIAELRAEKERYLAIIETLTRK